MHYLYADVNKISIFMLNALFICITAIYMNNNNNAIIIIMHKFFFFEMRCNSSLSLSLSYVYTPFATYV